MTSSGELGALGERVPDFFIVGQPKSGTTALYDMLAAHPQIFVPELREPAFFADELPRQDHRTTLPESTEEYRSLFADARPEQLIGERSAMYLWSASAARRIAAAQPAARIIAILREPASFLRSLHLQNLQSHYETEADLGAALALEDARRRGSGSRGAAVARRRCCTPSTCAPSSSCAATTRCSRPSRCWC